MGVTVNNMGVTVVDNSQSPKSFLNSLGNVLAYNAKDAYLREHYEEVSPDVFYSELFCHSFEPTGFDCSKSSGIGNPIVVASSSNETMCSYVVTESEHNTFYKQFDNRSCALVAPCVFYGRTAKSVNARYIYALVVDLDYVGLQQLVALLFQIYTAKVVPCPTFIVNSGTGLHLYYFSIEPYPAYPQTRQALASLKRGLINVCWNAYTSRSKPTNNYNPRQYSGVTQGYRLIGSNSKLGSDYKVKAYRTGKTWDFLDLNKYLLDDDRNLALNEDCIYFKSELPLSAAKEKYPDWYQKRVVEKQPKGTFIVKKDLFDWWFKKILQGGTVGHRYFCIGMLAVYAIKCDVSKEELLKKVNFLVPLFDTLGEDQNNHFTQDEAEKAVDTWYKQDYKTFPITSISNLSGIDIKKTKRNGRKRSDHILFMNNQRKFKVELGECTNGGRPKNSGTKEKIVKVWRITHPEGTKADCIRETGLTKTTVYKWW